MLQKLRKIKIFAFASLLFIQVKGQDISVDSSYKQDLVVSYNIDIHSPTKKMNIGETYNAGSKTVFVSKNKARVRLLSLMRIESIFFLPGQDSTLKIFRIKESGRKNNLLELTPAEWSNFNNKYDSTRCELVDADTKEILGYNCKKAIIHLQDGRSITAYYTENIKPLNAAIEPAFASLPGLALEYTYKYKSGSSTYTAVSIHEEPIDPQIFLLQGKYPGHIKL